MQKYWTSDMPVDKKAEAIDKIVKYLIKENYLMELGSTDYARFEKYDSALDLYLNEMDMLPKGVTNVDIDEIDTNYPSVFRRVYSLDKKVIVRGENNVNLFRDEFSK
jgi:hypothetical protein